MTNYNLKRLTLIAVLCMVLLGVGCTTEVDYTQGSEFVPSNQKMELKRRVYRGGVMTEGDSEVTLAMATSRNFTTDSLRSANLDNVYMGTELSDTFGVRSAGFMTQMMFSMSLHKDRGWGYRPIYDSMCLGLYINDYHGDTTIKQRFEVYEIISNDYVNLGLNSKGENDTTFYVNFDPTPYISAEPIFEFTFPNQERGVYVGDISNPQIRPVRLESTAATADYISRLMFLGDLEANGGFAYDKDSLYVNGNEEKFIEKVKGLYIKPVEEYPEGRGAVYSTNRANSAMYLYARGRYEEDPSIIRDTTYMLYNFYLSPSTYDLKVGNVAISTIEHDYSQVVTLGEGINLVDGMGGYVTEVVFTDEMIQSLADIITSHKDGVVSVNQAHLKVYLNGSDYNPAFISPVEITPILNNSMDFVSLYANYNNSISIADYLGGKSSTFDGSLNRSMAYYNMDISTFVQSLMLAASDNLLEDGKTVDLDKFREDYEPADESLAQYRRLYVGPAANNLFGMKRQAIWGGDAGGAAKAPISLELTYTIVD